MKRSRPRISTPVLLDRYLAELVPEKAPADPDILALAALYQALRRDSRSCREAATSDDPTSPWWATDNWRPNLVEEEHFSFHDGIREYEVGIAVTGNSREHSELDYVIRTGGQVVRASGQLEADGKLTAIMDTVQRRVDVVEDHDHLVIFETGNTCRLKRLSDGGQSTEEEATGNLISPMPGTIIEVMASEGQQVKKGDTLLVLEAMKIEHTIVAPHDGTVQALHYQAGDMVEEGVELLVLAEISSS